MKDGKDWEKLLDADKIIRKLFRARPGNCPLRINTLATIEVIGGFEAFNTRPYHNYETWGQGYRITAGNLTVIAEDLDVALERWRLLSEGAAQ